MQQQQQSHHMPNAPPPFPPQNVTTEQIQMLLDENKKLILAILEGQSRPKFSERAMYQGQLQKNLMFLAAIADAQPQEPIEPTQMTSHVTMQQGHNMQQSQATTAQQQTGVFPFQFSAAKPPQDQKQQQPLLSQFQQLQAVQRHADMGPGCITPMHQGIQAGAGPFSSCTRGDSEGGKHDGLEAGSGDRVLGFGHCGRD